MSIKVKDTKSTNSNVYAELDFLSDKKIPRDKREKIKREVGDFLVEQTLSRVANAKSPVQGEDFDALSDDYKKFKREQGLPGKPNLEFSGDMLDTYGFKTTGQGVKIGHFGTEEAFKANTHNNFTGEFRKKRRYIPNVGQTYKQTINAEVDRIINDNIVESETIPRRRLREVTDKTSFWTLMSSIYPELDRADIRTAIARSQIVTELLKEFDLLRFLRNGE